MVNDINEVIASLAKIDNASAMIMESTRKEKTAYAEEIKQKTKEFDDALAKNIEDKVTALKSSLEAENQSQIDSYKAESKENLAKLDSVFAAKKDEWVDSIFNHIIKE